MRWHLCFLLCMAGGLATAADAPPLPLGEAVARALAAAPQIAARAESASAARELATSAGRLPDPALTFGVDNLPVEGPDAWSTTADFMTMRTVGLMQEFPRREKRRLERERASVAVDLAGAELTEESLDVAREASRAWIRRAALESAARELRELRPDIELRAAAARAGVAAGRASTAEALAAQEAVVRLDNRILDVETEARQARIDLARWIGDEADRPPAPMPGFDRLPEPAAALVANAARHGPILPFEARLAAARTDVELARAEKRPDWSAALSFGKRGPEFSDMASLEFTIDLPLFSRHRQDPVIAARSAELRRIEADRETLLRAHAADVRKTLAEWERAGTQLERIERELLPLARERAAAALAAYRAGGGEFRLVLDAFENQIELAVERALLAEEQGSAWAYLRYLDARQLPEAAKEIP